MLKKGKKERATVDMIKGRIQLLNLTVLLSIFIALLLVVRFTQAFLQYLPMGSVLTMLTVMAGLSAAVYLISKTVAGSAVRAVEAYVGRLNSLISTSKKIQEIGYSDLLFRGILETTIGMTGADGGSLLMVENGQLRFEVVKGGMADKLAGLSIPKSQGIAGWVVENGKPLRVDDACKDGRFYCAVDKKTGYETKSVLCIPLKLGAETIGALELVSGKAGAFSKEDEELLQYFSDQAALSIEKARHYEDIKNFEIHVTNILVDAIENVSGKRGHAKRVAKYALMTASAIGMSDEEKKRLYRSALLHDIGYLRAGRASSGRPHPMTAFEMLNPIRMYSDIAPIILHFYEYGGEHGGAGPDSIPIESKVIGIANAFDSMVSGGAQGDVSARVGRAAGWLKRNAGVRFDARLVAAFLRALKAEGVDEAELAASRLAA